MEYITPREKELIKYIIKAKKVTIQQGTIFYTSKYYVKETYVRLVQLGYLELGKIGDFYPTKKAIKAFKDEIQ